MPFFFSKTCSQLDELGTPPHSAVCVGFVRTFFFRNPTFSGVFEKNNVSVIGNVFMQYFFSSLAIYWDRRKKVENEIFHHQTGAPDGCRHLWCYCKFKNVKVWKKSFRMMPFRAPYDKISLLWLLAKFSDFRWKSWIFENFWKNPKSLFRYMLYQKTHEHFFQPFCNWSCDMLPPDLSIIYENPASA